MDLQRMDSVFIRWRDSGFQEEKSGFGNLDSGIWIRESGLPYMVTTDCFRAIRKHNFLDFRISGSLIAKR